MVIQPKLQSLVVGNQLVSRPLRFPGATRNGRLPLPLPIPLQCGYANMDVCRYYFIQSIFR